jgi:benzylsuccinate CoA-transferase BbsF subunit
VTVFDGVKVADFAWVGAGPITTRYLSDYGATVVRIESATRPEFLRTSQPFRDGVPGVNRSAFYATFNGGKQGISLNLKTPKGLEVARRLIAWADIVSESFTAGTMQRLGLDYEQARRINPSVIYFSSTNQGQTGPYAAQPGFGTQLVSLAGLTNLSGWPDRDPAGTYGAYTDFMAPRFGAAALAGALEYRRRTGRGMQIDLSQLECAVHFLTPLVLEEAAMGRSMGRNGNRSQRAAPHNAYPCRGDDRWCVITVFTDADWAALRREMGDPEWAQESRFASLLGRKRNEEELDERIGVWTRGFDAHRLMEHLQEAGVPAGVVQTAPDLFRDPQLQSRGHFVEHEHPEIGRHWYERFAFRLSRSPGGPGSPGPLLGEHNESFYRDELGYDPDEIADMVAEGVIN